MNRKTVSGIMVTLLSIGMLTLAFNVQPAKAETSMEETMTFFNDGQLMTVMADERLEHTSTCSLSLQLGISDDVTAGVSWLADQELYSVVYHSFPNSDWIYVVGEAYAKGYTSEKVEAQLSGAKEIILSGRWGIGWGETSFFEVMLGLVESGYISGWELSLLSNYIDHLQRDLIPDGREWGINEWIVKPLASLALAEKLGLTVDRELVQDTINYISSVQALDGNILGYTPHALRGLVFTSELGYDIPSGIIEKAIGYTENYAGNKFSLYVLLLASEEDFVVGMELLGNSIQSLLEEQHLDGSWGSVSETAWAVKCLLYRPPIPATIDIYPETLNTWSLFGKWITAYIELPEGYDVNDIDISSVKLNGEVLAESHPTKIGDYDKDGIPDLMVKFYRANVVRSILRTGEDEITIRGILIGKSFEGSEAIRVVHG